MHGLSILRVNVSYDSINYIIYMNVELLCHSGKSVWRVGNDFFFVFKCCSISK